MLLRDGPSGIEVFMVVRHHAIDFASGALVFPGGRVEGSDHLLAAADACPNPTGMDTAAMAFRVAAIRETFEECGVLLARPSGSPRLIDAATLRRLDDRYREALNAGSISFDAMLAPRGWCPHPTCWCISRTGSRQPTSRNAMTRNSFWPRRRPNTWLCMMDTKRLNSIWITPAQALEDAGGGRFKLVFATAKNLEKLGRSRTVSAALEAAISAKVVTVQPHASKLEGTKRLLRIPVEADYGGGEFVVDMAPAS